MVNSYKSIQCHHAILSWTLLFVVTVKAQQTTNSTCTPTGCQAICAPACTNDQVCTLETMTSCNVCPISICVDRSILGLPPLSTSSSSSSSASSNNNGLIGGIVGGLLGLGILLAIGVYLYIRKSKKRLPFAFTTGSLKAMNDHTFSTSPPLTPHPAVVTAVTRHQAMNMSVQQQSQNTTTTTPTTLASSDSINTTSNNNPITLPDEFVEKIALQNRRISQILNNNPRLSLQPAPPPPITRNIIFPSSDRNSNISIITNTTDDESEMEEDEVIRTASSSPVQKFTRAKAQIMRVNSVRTNSGLSRSGSVRLTAVVPVEQNEVVENPFQ